MLFRYELYSKSMEVNILILRICSRSRNGPRERRWVSRSFVVNLRESQQKPELWFGRPCRPICHQLCCRGERNLAADQRWKSQGGPGRRHQDCQGTWKWPPRYAPSSILKGSFSKTYFDVSDGHKTVSNHGSPLDSCTDSIQTYRYFSKNSEIV